MTNFQIFQLESLAIDLSKDYWCGYYRTEGSNGIIDDVRYHTYNIQQLNVKLNVPKYHPFSFIL